MRRGTKDNSVLRRSAVARDARERRIGRGRVWTNFGRNEGAADPAFAMGQNELRWIESGLGDDRRIARGGTFSTAVDRGERRRMAHLYPVERGIHERQPRRRVKTVRRTCNACRRERRVGGQGAQGFAGFVDRMRLDGPRLGARAGKRRVGARGVVHACAGRRRRTESLDRAQRVGRVGGRGLPPSGHAQVARLRPGERGHDRAALFKPGLPGHEFVHLAVEGIPLEQLPARGFIELSARLGQTVLVSRLYFRLPREDCAHHVVVEGDIDGDGGGPGERDERERGKRSDAAPPEPNAADDAAPGERKTIMRPRRPRPRIALSQRHEPALQPSESGRARPQSKAH